MTLKVRNIAAICFALVLLWACSQQFRVVNGPVAYQSKERYATYTLIDGSVDSLHRATMRELNKHLEMKLSEFGLKEDAAHPDLLFITRWETHPEIVHSVKKDESVTPTYSITNPVYSPFHNTSDRLARPSSTSACNVQQESFFRLQAIDASQQEIVWSLKIYPKKSDINYASAARKVMQRLDYSFLNVSRRNSINKK